ncbi:MAG TPA: glycosyltransferase family 2 protein [Candidatus Solibacter sp.]|nr:glycosyltransferase family 2 protein [Candidatus Solibacter sp.]
MTGSRRAPRIAAVIPALNEAQAIAAVVRSLREHPTVHFADVIVVDNGSTDGTAGVAEAAGARAIRLETAGYGGACFEGVRAASNADVLVLLDGDASDDPADLDALLAPVLRDEADLVVGSRRQGRVEAGAMTPQQVFGNRLTGWLMRRLYGLEVTDLGPLRAIRPARLNALEMRERTYGWSVEMMVKAARAGYRYREVPVNYRRRIGVSKVGGTLHGSLRAGWAILATTWRYRNWTRA